MNQNQTRLVAVVTSNPNVVAGGVPVFVKEDPQQREQLAYYLAKITLGMVHMVDEETYVVARH